MSKYLKSHAARSQLAWLLPLMALSPLALGAKGCTNAGVVGDDCPTVRDCPSGSAGKGSAGSGGGGTGEVCGGLVGAECADGQFCSFPTKAQCGAADQTGLCVSRPEACPAIDEPVCGCDDKTYSNACLANDAGVSVAHAGECQPSGAGGGTGTGGGTGSGGSTGTGDFCGGIAAIECPPDQYCRYPLTAQCGAADQGGSCVSKPEVCPAIAAPVCGCDGKTYGNGCMAAHASVSVAADGECKATGKACGEIGGCDEGQYCNFPPESECGLADGPGVCTAIPVDRACITLYAPVCGCDGKTYGNDCEANAAGMSVAAEGECDAPVGETCGGLQGKGCKPGYFCDFPPDMPCGNADGTGTCVRSFEACDQVLARVCGCDGTTYGNECTANAEGTDISHTGACN